MIPHLPPDQRCLDLGRLDAGILHEHDHDQPLDLLFPVQRLVYAGRAGRNNDHRDADLSAPGQVYPPGGYPLKHLIFLHKDSSYIAVFSFVKILVTQLL